MSPSSGAQVPGHLSEGLATISNRTPAISEPVSGPSCRSDAFGLPGGGRRRSYSAHFAGWFSAGPPERLLTIVDDVPPARVSAISVPARSVLVPPDLTHAGARSVVRTKSLFAAVGATFEHSRLGFHSDQLFFRGQSLNSSGIPPIGFCRFPFARIGRSKIEAAGSTDCDEGSSVARCRD